MQSYTVFTVGAAGAVLSITVTVFVLLVFFALSIAVTDSFVLAFCLLISTENVPLLVAVPVPRVLLPAFILTLEPASAFPVTLKECEKLQNKAQRDIHQRYVLLPWGEPACQN
ncbi:hypothetical protein AAEO50_01090 [Rossellomorea oryzaecorticis]|uniref:Uncharacterized protein n=1 Tax=Rossellomorea oryzaecorticis TaxID=1396505 RepID=A0ABU9K476_9BACI